MRRSLPLLLALAFALAPAGAQAAPHAGVQPDPTFGNGHGYVTLSFSGATAVAYGATATTGGIVVAGQEFPASGNAQLLVAKFDHSGDLDPHFATHGIYRGAFPDADGPFIANAVARDAHGRLLVAGGYGLASALVLRLTPTGHLDTSFGTNGFTTIATGDVAQSLAVQKDGRILVGTSNRDENGRPMVVARLTASGAVDASFGTNGRTEVLFWDPIHAAGSAVSGLATTANGDVVASGHIDYIGGDGHGSAGVFELSSTGQLVPGYGTGGSVEIAFTNPDGSFAQWFPCALALGPNGRATVSGDGSTAAGDAILAARLTPAGAPDPRFGTTGDGRVVAPGASGGGDTTCGAELGEAGDFTLGAGSSFAQLGPEGSPNGSFAPGGIKVIEAPGSVTLNAVVLPAPHRVVLVGQAGNNDIYVSRWLLPRAGGHHPA
jgi:uncharacterized delta-60 repeat protein